MAKQAKSHPYADPQAFDRLMLLIATLVNYPGVGYRENDRVEISESGNHHNALEALKNQLRELAAAVGFQLPEGYPATPTLRRDLEKLRDYYILDRRMYRWGYYLGTGVMNQDELKVAFNALESQAIYQGDPRIRQIYHQLRKRLRGFEFNEVQTSAVRRGKDYPKQDFFYPVRQHLNRAINYTDPQEMMEKGEFRNTLFHQIDKVEGAIVEGQAIEISRSCDLYGHQKVGPLVIWPLQLIYYDIAWYLLYESCSNGCLAIARLNRFSNYCQILTPGGRGIEAQKQSLKKAYRLLKNGWGFKLGELEEQQLELRGELEFVRVKVRFFPPVSSFIEEGELRHPHQKIRRGPKDNQTGKPHYVDYCLELPPRSLDEFSIWVQRYGDRARVLSPSQLVEKHRQAALNLVDRYAQGKANN
jgi:predicted DNA-binding transcriptional regulator YafY